MKIRHLIRQLRRNKLTRKTAGKQQKLKKVRQREK
jgi:hypothetical protein